MQTLPVHAVVKEEMIMEAVKAVELEDGEQEEGNTLDDPALPLHSKESQTDFIPVFLDAALSIAESGNHVSSSTEVQ